VGSGKTLNCAFLRPKGFYMTIHENYYIPLKGVGEVGY